MKELKEIVTCTVPFMVSAIMLYPLMAIMGGNTDPFMWERADRAFYFIITLAFGGMLLHRINYVRKWEGK